MQIVAQRTVFFLELDVGRVGDELFEEAVAFGRLGVSVRNVLDRHRFGTVVFADPVGIGQVDADRGSREAIAAEHRGGDDLRGYALHLLFAVFRVDRRVVLEPLRLGADRFGASRRLLVAEVHEAFPRGAVAQRVSVRFDEAVDEIDFREGVLHPGDTIGVELRKVARTVIADQLVDRPFLCSFSHSGGLLEPVNDLLDRGRVHAVHFPHFFHQLAVLFDQLAVQAV